MKNICYAFFLFSLLSIFSHQFASARSLKVTCYDSFHKPIYHIVVDDTQASATASYITNIVREYIQYKMSCSSVKNTGAFQCISGNENIAFRREENKSMFFIIFDTVYNCR